jgi:hypothetical protein
MPTRHSVSSSNSTDRWLWRAGMSVSLAAGVDSDTPVAIGAAVAVFVFGILAATGSALAGTIRHAPLRNGLLDRRGVAAILVPR